MLYSDDAILEMKNSNDYILKKLILTTFFQVGHLWRGGAEPKLISEVNFSGSKY